ncbi:MAG: smalltalk protein [Prevotella sp.]|nr:smalltalk protein [Prevotella sp.]
MSKTTSKINWVKVLEAIAQALIAALTALGVSSCKF